MKVFLALALVYISIAGLSWIITCGLIYLIALCFGWTFSWLIATGVWLAMFLLKAIFSHHTTIHK